MPKWRNFDRPRRVRKYRYPSIGEHGYKLNPDPTFDPGEYVLIYWWISPHMRTEFPYRARRIAAGQASTICGEQAVAMRYVNSYLARSPEDGYDVLYSREPVGGKIVDLPEYNEMLSNYP